MALRPVSISLALILCGLPGAGCAGAPNRSIQRNPGIYSRAIERPREFRDGLARSCDRLPDVNRVISQAIAIGAPIYNAGSPLGCYRIYEGGAYKLLFQLDDACPELTGLLRAGLAQAEADAAIDHKAWTMRRTFDAILGAETTTGPRAERSF